MNNILLGALGALVLIIIGFFSSRKTTREDAKILDLTVKIKGNQEKANAAQKDANQKVKEYQDALKEYDPDFYSDDHDPKPKGSA